MLQTSGDLVEKTVDCLRIITTGNNRNKLALFSIPAGVRRLISIMAANKPSAVCWPHDILCQIQKLLLWEVQPDHTVNASLS